MENNLIHLAALHCAWFTQKDLAKLMQGQSSADTLFSDLLRWNLATPWIPTERRKLIDEQVQKINLEAITQTCLSLGIQIININDNSYPLRLKTLKSPPYVIYIRGNLDEKKLMFGIVGSRKSTSYSNKILEHIIPTLVAIDSGIVSGWAHGVDALAHEITLNQDGYTISVFGSGIDIYYPVKNRDLFARILSSWWALLSVFPIGTLPEPYMFPVRNEIVAALSDGVIIPEAWLKSGTLITAGLALEQGRDVFAVPWDIFRETSAGTNMLIASGQAKAISKIEDILEEYLPRTPESQTSFFEEKVFDSDWEKIVFWAIQNWYQNPDLIGQNTDLSIEEIIMTLTLLEINGHIRLWKNGSYEIL